MTRPRRPAGRGGSPAESPRTGSISRASTERRGTPTRPSPAVRTGSRPMSRSNPTPASITDCALTKASGEASSDAAVGLTLLAHETRTGRGARRLRLRHRRHARRASLTPGTPPLIKPWPLRPAVPGGFTIDDFDVDGPAPAPSPAPTPSPGRSPATGARSSAPPARLPAASPMHHRRSGRTLAAAEHHALLRAHRRPGRRPRLPGHLPPASAHGRTHPSPGWSPAATDGCATAASSATTPGCTPASPRSTCADCSRSACSTATEPGSSPDRGSWPG